MQPHVSETLQLLHELLAKFLDHAEAIQIEVREVPGACYWSVKTHSDDMPKAVGRGGAHVRALGKLLAQIGTANDEVWKLKLNPPDPGSRREESPPKRATAYDPTVAEELLGHMAAAALGCTVEIETALTGHELLAYTFRIHPEDPHAFANLVAQHEADPYAQSLISALSVLWRAWGLADGVKFTVEAKP
jgi:predicted RNA-binding protein YlqC (UPF0109 family)